MQPYNTANVMIWDDEEQIYYLHKDYIKTRLNIDLDAEAKKPSNVLGNNFPDIWSKDVSHELYDFVFAHNDNVKLASIMKYVPSVRAIIQKALEYWVTFKANSGNLSERSGVLYDKGVIMDRRLLNVASVPPRAESVLNRIIPELGYSLLYAGRMIRYNEEDYTGE